MLAAMIGLIVGNILGGLIVGNWPLTLGVFLGQVSTMIALAIQGYLRTDSG
jgi:hypothetical protein